MPTPERPAPGSTAPAAAMVLPVLLALLPLWARAHGVADEELAELARQARSANVLPFGLLGLRHMLQGADHLAFVAALALGHRGWRETLWLLSLFSLGHSLTLYLGLWWPLPVPAEWVDAGIAGSVALAAALNLRQAAPTARAALAWRAAVAALGLVHGVGLAGGLRPAAAVQDHLTGKLLAFNAGVELAQALLLLALLVLMAALRALQQRWAVPPARLRRGANLALAVAGCALAGWHLALYTRPQLPDAQATALPWRSEVLELRLAPGGEPGDGVEWTMAMKRGAQVVYSWSAEVPDERLYSDFHGTHADGQVRSHHSGTGRAAAGWLRAAADGPQGWYFQNSLRAPVVVRVQVAGFYEPQALAPAP